MSEASASLSIIFCIDRGLILRPLLETNIALSRTSWLSLILLSLIGSHDSRTSTEFFVKRTVRSFSPFPPITNADRSSLSMSSISRAQSSETLSPVSSIRVDTGIAKGSSDSLTAILSLSNSLLPRVFGSDLFLDGLCIQSGTM